MARKRVARAKPARAAGRPDVGGGPLSVVSVGSFKWFNVLGIYAPAIR
jgi:hypothetical protein